MSRKGSIQKLLNKLREQQISIQRKILRVTVYTPICKPLNGSLPGSSNSHLLKLWTFPYQYKNGKEVKETTATAYLPKGIRGAIRHQAMTRCKIRGLEVCHTSDKEKDKKGNSLLPEGFHLLGSCIDNGECIIHSIFGSKGHRSKIRVTVIPIANISHKTYQTEYKIQNVQIATEKRVCLSFDGKSIQDFGERYFSGEFQFEIDATECSPLELGLVIESVMYLNKLGRGFNAGYAELEVKKLSLILKNISRCPKWVESNEFLIEEKVIENALPEEVTQALLEWQNYLIEK
jgi:hypothetical protein